MKFLEDSFNNKNIMPLNIYYNSGGYNNSDVIDIIFKDMDTNKKYVHTIENPKIEVWITKKEYRNYNYIKNFFEKSKCYPLLVSYKYRYQEVAKHLGITPDEAKCHPYIFQIDMQIEHFYLINFIIEYKTDKVKKLSIGYLDIENDIIQVDRFPEPGEAPINAVTFIDENTLNVYTLVLIKDNLPYVDETHPNYNKIENMRKSYYEQTDYFMSHIEEFKNQCHEMFDDSYGVLNYNILMFDKEAELIKILFQIIKASDNDYIEIWNSPYDMQNLIERPKQLGLDTDEIITDKSFGERHVYFKEDPNHNVHKRKHICNTYTMPTFVDQMVIYAGIRSGRGKLPSVKLNYIAQKELKDEKLDYSESGNIKQFYYDDFWKYILYNIKDVLLQYGVNKKTKDSASAYTTIYSNAVLPHEIFTSTTILANSIRMFAFLYKDGYLMGVNKNKILPPNDINKMLEKILGSFKIIDENISEDYEEPDFIEIDYEDDEEEEFKEEKFEGAHVQNPQYMTSTGYELMGTSAKYIHDFVIDEDIRAEYPSAIITMNASNDTFIAKVFIEDPSTIDVGIFDLFTFRGKDREKYKLDVSNHFMEVLSENDVFNLGHIYMDLPEPTEILNYIDENLDKFKK